MTTGRDMATDGDRGPVFISVSSSRAKQRISWLMQGLVAGCAITRDEPRDTNSRTIQHFISMLGMRPTLPAVVTATQLFLAGREQPAPNFPACPSHASSNRQPGTRQRA